MKILTRLDFCRQALVIFLVLIWILAFGWTPASCGATRTEKLISLIGQKDSLLVIDPDGRILISKNETQKRIPASILKIFTSLVALHYLGADYRYQTEFFIDKHSNLKIKGFGDPLLISEVVRNNSRLLAALLGSSFIVNDLVVDDSFFSQPLTIPGVSSSSQPYDAPNGALCVNFNTVFFKHTNSGYVSAESQTPLLPYAEEIISARNLKSGRIVLSHLKSETTVYAGKLFEHFLRQEGIRFSGDVKLGRVIPSQDKLIYRYVSPFTLTQIIAKLLEHSNNFTTNQLLISAGVKAYGPPGNLEKGVAAAVEYASRELQTQNMTIVEGSGISRQNRVSALQMIGILQAFEPNFLLLRQKGRDFYKTGTLHGIHTRAGYIASKNGGRYRYVVMVNTGGKSTQPIMHQLLQLLE
jgi:D-alanyl-D-alanine carboxypeptidase/D-alanyl-D-alanine-endopeptidase (penicillin-binding protein 4)